jgi:Ribbon-helix-helix protein, copG family
VTRTTLHRSGLAAQSERVERPPYDALIADGEARHTVACYGQRELPHIIEPEHRTWSVPHRAHQPHDIVVAMTDILIRDVPDEVVAALDANAQRTGQTRAEYLRRLLADQQRPALTRDQLNRFAERTVDLGNPEVMAAAWR